MIEAELHDGRILEFPDGTDPAVVQSTVKRLLAEGKQPERPAYATQALHGANEAIMAPVRVVENLIAEKIFGTSKRPVSDFLKRNLYPSEAQTPGERIARSAGAMVPETALMAGTLAAAAPAVPTALINRTAPGLAEYLAQSILRPYETAAPATTAIADVFGALGAGAASQAHKEYVADPTASGEFASGMAGGALGAGVPAAGAAYSRYSPLAVGSKIIRNALLANLPEETISRVPGLSVMADARRGALRQQELPRVAKEFAGLREPEMQARFDQAGALRQEIPDFNPSLAEATGLPSAIAAQRTIEREASGADLDALARRKALSEDALRRYQDREAPGAPELAQETVAKAMQGRVEKVRAAHEGQTRALAEQAIDLPDRLPATDIEAQGAKLRDRMMTLRGEESARMSKLAEESGMDDKTWLPFHKLQKRIKDVKPSRFAGDESMGATLQTIMDYKAGAGTPVNFQDIKYLREQLGDEIRMAERAGERNKARVLRNGRDQIDEFLDNDVPAALFQGDTGLQVLYKNFRETYKRDYIDRFEAGAGREAKRIGPDQRYRTADEDVASDFFNAGDVRAARDFKSVFKDDPEAAAAMQASILDSARAAAVKDGAVDKRALDRWLKAHDSVLAQFPEARAVVQDAGRAAEAIEARRATLALRGRRIGDTKFAKAAGGDPDKAVDALLADKRMAERAIRAMDRDEKEAFGRAMWDFALPREKMPSPETIGRFLSDHGDIARKVMSPEHLKALRNLESAWRMNERVPPPVGRRGDASAIKAMTEATGSGPLQISSRIFAAASGRTSARMVMLDLLARAGVATSQKEATAIAREALYDAGFARELANYVRDPSSRAGKDAVPKIKSYVNAMALRAAEPEPDQDRPE